MTTNRRDLDELWFIECSHNVDGGWTETQVCATYEHADMYRRMNGYRPRPLVMVEGWTNDVWYKPVYVEWDTFLEEEEVHGDDRDQIEMEHAEITLGKLWTP